MKLLRDSLFFPNHASVVQHSSCSRSFLFPLSFEGKYRKDRGLREEILVLPF